MDDEGGSEKTRRRKLECNYSVLVGLSKPQLRIVMIQYSILKHEKLWWGLLALALSSLLFSSSCRAASGPENFWAGAAVGILLFVLAVVLFIKYGNGNSKH